VQSTTLPRFLDTSCRRSAAEAAGRGFYHARLRISRLAVAKALSPKAVIGDVHFTRNQSISVIFAPSNGGGATMKFWLATMVFFGCAVPLAQATEVTVYDSCTDAAGKIVSAEIDYALPVLVRSLDDRGQATIHYNPSLLPRLKPATRLFLFARECGRGGLRANNAATALEPSLAEARRADCLAVATLLGAGLLQRLDLAGLQGDLHFSAEEWKLLPGPAREFDFATCPRRDVLKMPLASLPTAQQTVWNACVRSCGDHLRSCQKSCRSEACDSRCLAVYDQCEAPCAGN
jgi:hypothetical protein